MLVTHGADLHAPLPLPVPLAEELLHDAVRPLAVQLQGLGGVAQVRTVHHVLEYLDAPTPATNSVAATPVTTASETTDSDCSG